MWQKTTVDSFVQAINTLKAQPTQILAFELQKTKCSAMSKPHKTPSLKTPS